MGTLNKPIIRNFVPAVYGSPGFPGTPGSPARSYKTKQIVCTFAGLADTGSNSTDTKLPARQVCTEKTVTVYVPSSEGTPSIPSTPGVAAKITESFQLGWNSRALTNYSLVGAGEYSFTVPPSSVGVVVGMTQEHRTSGFSDIRFAFSVARGQVKVMESGQAIVDLGAQPNALLSIKRQNRQIVYSVNGTPVYSRPAPTATMTLAAAMYSGGDQIVDAQREEFDEEASAGITLPPLGMVCGAAYASLNIEIPPLSTSMGGMGRGSLQVGLQGLDFHCGGAYGVISTALAPMLFAADGHGTMPYALADLETLPMIAGLNGLTGEIGGVTIGLSGMDMFAGDRPMGQTSFALPPLIARADAYYGPDQAVLYSRSSVVGTADAVGVVALLMRADMTVVGVLSVSAVAALRISSAVTAITQATTTQTLALLMDELVEAGILQSDEAKEMSVWVLNDDVGGMTRYEDYEFESFATVNGVTFGAKEDGIYRLEGPDDDGSPIKARIDFGRKNFGSLERKTMRYVYVGMAAGGQTVLKVGADDAEYLYTIRDVTELQKAHRFELGRGLRASFYDVEIHNVNGAAFDLSTIEYHPAGLRRKL